MFKDKQFLLCAQIIALGAVCSVMAMDNQLRVDTGQEDSELESAPASPIFGLAVQPEPIALQAEANARVLANPFLIAQGRAGAAGQDAPLAPEVDGANSGERASVEPATQQGQAGERQGEERTACPDCGGFHDVPRPRSAGMQALAFVSVRGSGGMLVDMSLLPFLLDLSLEDDFAPVGFGSPINPLLAAQLGGLGRAMNRRQVAQAEAEQKADGGEMHAPQEPVAVSVLGGFAGAAQQAGGQAPARYPAGGAAQDGAGDADDLDAARADACGMQ